MTVNTFEDKSDKSFESAELLVKNSHKNSSIHSYYYSCFQLLNHFLIVHCRFTELDIKEFSRTKESHNDVISEVKKKLDEEEVNYIKLFSELNLIKKERVKADYGMAFVTDTEDTKKKTMFFREQFKSLINDI